MNQDDVGPSELSRELDGMVALVTGGSRGIGAAISAELVAHGARVAVNYRESERASKELVERLGPDNAFAIRADVSDPEDAQRLVSEVRQQAGTINILVNNAGIAEDELIFNMDASQWQSVMNTNFGGVFNCTKAVLEPFSVQRSGAIVNISSVMADRGWVGQANYAASKGAINSFTRCAAVELARFGIRVNAVLPGFSPTDLVAGLVESGAGAKIEKQIPMKRFGDNDEIAPLVRFLCSPSATYVTGGCFVVDGGASAQLGLGKP